MSLHKGKEGCFRVKAKPDLLVKAACAPPVTKLLGVTACLSFE